MKIAASFLSVKDNLKENVKLLSMTSVNYIHIDIMDNYFVPNKTWNIGEIRNIVDGINKPLDVHLMVDDVISYINDFKIINPEYITFHLEAVDNALDIIEYIKGFNIKVGISIKPNTDINALLPYLNKIDLVLLMSVEPGFGGQTFLKSTANKVDMLNEIRKKNNYKYLIEVDGGINKDTINYIKNADIAVVGSYITSSSNYQEMVDSLK